MVVAETSKYLRTRVHVWVTTTGKVVCIDCRKGDYLTSNSSYSASNTKWELNGREHELVTFSGIKKNNFTIEGAIMHSEEFGYTDCTVAEVKALVGTHCLYRDPRNNLMYVAVTDVQTTSYYAYTTVSVSMTEETR